MDEARYELITCIVQRGKADDVWEAVRKAGASGATVSFGRGMGVRERLGLLGFAIAAEKEILQLVVPKEDVEPVLHAMVKAGQLDTPGMGFVFTQPVYHAIGFAPAGEPDTGK